MASMTASAACGRQRTREQVALRVRAAEPLELARLHFALDPFGDHAGVERPGQREDALDDGRTSGQQQAGDERSVDLERVHRQLVQVAQRRIAGPEVVEIDLDAEVAQLAQHVRGLAGTIQQRGLRDFHAQVGRPQPGLPHRLLDDAREILLHELPARHVHGDAVETGAGILPLPVGERAAGFLEDPRAERLDQPELLGDRNERDRRDRLPVARPADQRLEPDAHPRGQRHDRLVVAPRSRWWRSARRRSFSRLRRSRTRACMSASNTSCRALPRDLA